MKPLTPHWADQTAARIVGACGERDVFTVASGITPSGTIHIGNFREVITVDLVARALRSIGKKVRFIYSWDDFDTLRKVPKNLPQQDMLKENLRHPISRVPDPYGRDQSYAAHNITDFENELKMVGIDPEYLYQSQRYSDGIYAEEIKKALDHKDKIREILNRHRTKELDEDWLPTSIYCEVCERDQMHYQRYLGEYRYGYHCSSCGHKDEVDIRKTKNLKLNWRTDWPMRWAYEKVDFEPGGKDHSSDGGSYDTGKEIVKEIWNWNPPQYLQYDFVFLKGGPGKMSSSSGELVTLGEACEVYEPQMVRWIFASQRPNTDFAISFDVDVIKVYDEFDRAEKQALANPPENMGKWQVLRRTYELSCLSDQVPEEAPYRAPFRELCTRLQICDGEIEKTLNRFYHDVVKTAADHKAFQSRAERALCWLKSHAPAEFRYVINQSPVAMSMTEQEEKALEALRQLIAKQNLTSIDPKDLNQLIYDDVIRATEVDPKAFFRVVYQKLMNRDQGPRLPSFLIELGKERVLALLV